MLAHALVFVLGDLWINIKQPYTIKDVPELPQIGCELMHRDPQREVVRCSNWVPSKDWAPMMSPYQNIQGGLRVLFMNFPAHANTEGEKTPCRVMFNYTGSQTNRWDAYTRPPCKQYWQNNNTLDIF